MGHGGGNHKKHPAMAGRAQRLVTGCGFHVAVIDAPGHGDRPRTAHDEQEIGLQDEGGLRVGVQGGGCSGLSYAMRLDTQARDRDKIFEEFGARVFVDAKSLLYLNGTTLDYEETLMRQGFVFINPQAARSCGCGSSFTA